MLITGSVGVIIRIYSMLDMVLNGDNLTLLPFEVKYYIYWQLPYDL